MTRRGNWNRSNANCLLVLRTRSCTTVYPQTCELLTGQGLLLSFSMLKDPSSLLFSLTGCAEQPADPHRSWGEEEDVNNVFNQIDPTQTGTLNPTSRECVMQKSFMRLPSLFLVLNMKAEHQILRAVYPSSYPLKVKESNK